MAGKYLPPHMRKENLPVSSSADATLSQSERSPEDGYTTNEIAHQFNCKHKVSTLNSNSKKGKECDSSSLAFIIIFKNQHPQWPPKIFCKSNLNLLPDMTGTQHETYNSGSETEQSPESQQRPNILSGLIPVFQELRADYVAGARPEKRYVFMEYYYLTSISYLQPGSRELIEMLDAKFTPESKQRSAEAWNASLSYKWAVVSLNKTEEKERKENPMVPLKGYIHKSVTERLEELRLKKHDSSREWKMAAWGGGKMGKGQDIDDIVNRTGDIALD